MWPYRFRILLRNGLQTCHHSYEVQHKLLKLVVVFGIKQKKDGSRGKDGGRGDEMLRQLEASQTTALEQDLVDDILSEFGCS